MPVNTPSFPYGQKYQPVDSAAGQYLTKDTFISGRIILLWPFKPDGPHIRFAMSVKYPSNMLSSAYASTISTGTEKWKFTIDLLPSASSLKSGQTAQEVIKAEYDDLRPYLGSDVKVSGQGLKIMGVNGKELHLEGSGARPMWTAKRGTWTVFQDTTQSSTTPSWLEADPILPSSAESPPRIAPQAGPSHFRPISSHLPQQLNLRPTNSPTKRKRTLSPEKRSEAPPRQVPSIPKKVIELGNGKPLAFARLTSGFESTALRGSSSIGDALAGSSSTSLETAPPASQVPDPPVAIPPQLKSIPLEMPPISTPRRPALEALAQAPVNAPPPNKVAKSRAEAEAEARLQGTRRVEQQLAQQRAEKEAATLLERGLEVTDVTYTPIRHLRDQNYMNVIGVIVSGGTVNPPKGNRPDPLLSVVFTDPSVYKGEGAAAEDLVVSIFRKKVSDLPVDLVRGTPILFRRIKITKFNEKVKGNMYTGAGSWAYLMDGKLGYSSGGLRPALQQAEVDRLTEMGQWWRKTSGDSQAPGPTTQLGGSPAIGGSKSCLLGDARSSQFFDGVFKILHVHSGMTMHFELYVTDGSVSPMPLRNFHNVSHKDIPTNAIYCISIKGEPPASELACYGIGNTIILGNIRAKTYNNELEFIWANLVTEDQATQGWTKRRPKVLPKEDPRSLAIEQRLANLKKASRDGPDVEPPSHRIQDDGGQYIRTRAEVELSDNLDVPVAAEPNVTAEMTPLTIALSTKVISPNDVPMATHLFTIFTDPVDHGFKTIAEVLSNPTFPNKFRVKARVKSIHTRGLPGKETFVQRHCGHCKRAILKTMYCQSCQDVNMKNAAWCYRFLVILEDEESTIPVLISDYEADRFLPSLPPISASTNPNDVRKTGYQIAAANKKVVDVLQGGAMDLVRPRPWIDWTLQSSVVQPPKGYAGLKGEKGIVVYKAFGMTSN